MRHLVRANLAENPSLQLSKREMVSEMSGLTIAGHETTANTLTWLLWELSKNTQLQDLLREEIRLKRQEIARKNGDRVDLNMEDLESMPFLQALLKASTNRSFTCLSIDTNFQLRKFLDSTQSFII